MSEQTTIVVETKPPPDASKLREAAKQYVGQADRTNKLFVDIVIDLQDRVQRLEEQAVLRP